MLQADCLQPPSSLALIRLLRRSGKETWEQLLAPFLKDESLGVGTMLGYATEKVCPCGTSWGLLSHLLWSGRCWKTGLSHHRGNQSSPGLWGLRILPSHPGFWESYPGSSCPSLEPECCEVSSLSLHCPFLVNKTKQNKMVLDKGRQTLPSD